MTRRCEPLTFTDDDGQVHTALVQVHGRLSAEDRAALTEIAAAAIRQFAAEPPCPNDPPCPHSAGFHNDGRCVVRVPRPGCSCGHPAAAS